MDSIHYFSLKLPRRQTLYETEVLKKPCLLELPYLKIFIIKPY